MKRQQFKPTAGFVKISLITGVLVAFAAIVVVVVFPASANHDPFGGVVQTGNIDICHSNGSGGYVANSPAINSNGGNPQGHNNNGAHVGDIIPPYHYLDGQNNVQSYPGRNWNAANEAIWNNGCNAVTATPTPTPTPTATPTPTSTGSVEGGGDDNEPDCCPGVDPEEPTPAPVAGQVLGATTTAAATSTPSVAGITTLADTGTNYGQLALTLVGLVQIIGGAYVVAKES